MSKTRTPTRAFTLRVGDEIFVDGILLRLGQFAPRGRRAVVLEIDGNVPVRRIKKKEGDNDGQR